MNGKGSWDSLFFPFIYFCLICYRDEDRKTKEVLSSSKLTCKFVFFPEICGTLEKKNNYNNTKTLTDMEVSTANVGIKCSLFIYSKMI